LKSSLVICSGFPASRSLDGKVTYLRTDQYPYRIAALHGAESDLQYVCFDVGGRVELSDWESKLSSAGIQWRRGMATECAERQIGEFIEFTDPDGHTLALTYGFKPREDPVQYTRELRVVGLGHVLLTVADTQRAHDFYTGVLGFRLSDWVNIDEHVRLCFLTLQRASS
jgi:3,4-dihydroxy-9,10-secoandrosta-1,3,5(10)-triene-9,17-dione 4,5-dioxygenase